MDKLSQFTVRPEGDGFVLSLQSDGGATAEMSATADQLDAIIDTIDEVLGDYEEDIMAAAGGEP